jgi:uncharacterized lipoprotein YmbA
MTMIGRRQIIASLCGTLTVTSCASPSPNLYTIAPAPSITLSSKAKVVVLRSVGVSQYLIRRQIVRSSDNYRIDVLENDWWGEPLDAMLTRVLVQELSDRLPQSTVYQAAGAVTATPDASIEVELARLDLANGQLLLIAKAAVSSGGRVPVARRSFRILVTPPTTDTAGQVAATSSAVGQMADGIAEMVARQPIA